MDPEFPPEDPVAMLPLCPMSSYIITLFVSEISNNSTELRLHKRVCHTLKSLLPMKII